MTDFFNSTTVTAIMNTTAANDVRPDSRKVVLNGLCGLVLALSLYLFIVLLVYERSLHSNIASMLRKSIKKTMISTGTNTPRKVGKGLRVLCILSAALCTCSCILDLVYYNVEIDSAVGCTLTRNFGVMLLTMLDVTIYLFLWLRQFLVYQGLAFESRLVKNVINVLKWTTLAFIIGIFVATNSLLACCRRYEYVNNRCNSTTTDAVDNAIGYIWSTGSIILHFTLVLMFVFPLVRLKKKSLRKGPAAAAMASQKRMMELVRRCLIISLVCVITDLLVMFLTNYVFTASSQSQLRHLLYDLNVLLNSMSIVVSFREWEQMLLPCVKASGRATTAVQPGDTRTETPQTVQAAVKH